MLLLCILLTLALKQLQLVINNTTFSTHSMNAILSAYANLAMVMSNF